MYTIGIDEIEGMMKSLIQDAREGNILSGRTFFFFSSSVSVFTLLTTVASKNLGYLVQDESKPNVYEKPLNRTIKDAYFSSAAYK